jgi:hypothetical protein
MCGGPAFDKPGRGVTACGASTIRGNRCRYIGVTRGMPIRWRLSPRSHRRGRMLRAVLVGVGFFALCLTVACHKPIQSSAAIKMEHEITPQPLRTGPAAVTLRLTDSVGRAITGAHVAVEGDMTHAGMSPIFSEAQELEPGSYRANLRFSMGGDWVVLVHSTLSNGQKFEEQFEVKGVLSD